MKTSFALLIKFAMILAAAWITFWLFGEISFYSVLILAAAVTVLNYAIGDLLVLPWFGNATASVVDGIVGGIAAYAVMVYYPAAYLNLAPIYTFAVIIAAAEFFYHLYLLKNNIAERKKAGEDLFKGKNWNYNTETGDELYPNPNQSDLSKEGSNAINSTNHKKNDNR